MDRGPHHSMVVWPASRHPCRSELAYQFRRHDTLLLPDRAPHHERRLGVGGGEGWEAGSLAGAGPLHEEQRPALRRAAPSMTAYAQRCGAAATHPWRREGREGEEAWGWASTGDGAAARRATARRACVEAARRACVEAAGVREWRRGRVVVRQIESMGHR